jgi:hypothetical protein
MGKNITVGNFAKDGDPLPQYHTRAVKLVKGPGYIFDLGPNWTKPTAVCQISTSIFGMPSINIY